MTSLLSYYPLYILIVGMIIAIFSYKYISLSSVQAKTISVNHSENVYEVANRYLHSKNVDIPVVVHDGNATLFHRKDKVLYINEETAKSKNLCSYANVMHEVGIAEWYSTNKTLFQFVNYTNLIIRTLSMLTPWILVVSIFAQWIDVIKAIIILFDISIIFSLCVVPNEKRIGTKIKGFAKDNLNLDQRDFAIFSQVVDSMAWSASSIVFMPFAFSFKYLKTMANTLSTKKDNK